MPIAETAGAWGTAQGATVDTQDGLAGATQTALAQTASATGAASPGRVQVSVRAGVLAVGSAGEARVSALSARLRVHAGVPATHRGVPGLAG